MSLDDEHAAVARVKAAGWELVTGEHAHYWRKDDRCVSLRRALAIEDDEQRSGLRVIGPSRPPCADCGDDESTIYYERDGEWACDEPAFCIERQRDQAQEQLRGAVDLLREAKPAVMADTSKPIGWRMRWANEADAITGGQ